MKTPMNRWEYMAIGYNTELLNARGAEGWEWAGDSNHHQGCWLLKRPLPPPAPEPKTSHFIMGEQVIAPRTATEVSAMEALHRWQANWKQAFNELRASLTVKSIADRGYMPLVISAKRVLDLTKDDLTPYDRDEEKPPNAPREVPQWSSEPPTQEGWYWFQPDQLNKTTPEMIEARRFGAASVCYYGKGWGGHDASMAKEHWPRGRWIGPLEVPTP